ncbi:hypothetical protein J6590_048221 [Homalodisca vitripennis]|nr:hypothetical protein J6590_048221 [Homalodisca vitripennis]
MGQIDVFGWVIMYNLMYTVCRPKLLGTVNWMRSNKKTPFCRAVLNCDCTATATGGTAFLQFDSMSKHVASPASSSVNALITYITMTTMLCRCCAVTVLCGVKTFKLTNANVESSYVQHLKTNAAADWIPEIWSYLRLKGSQNSW